MPGFIRSIFAGIWVSDVLRLVCSDFRDGRLFYKMGRNSKVLSLKIPDKATKILQKYEDDKQSENDFVFPEMKLADLDDANDLRNKIKNGNRTINKQLKKIAEELRHNKILTIHISDHTFGNVSDERIPLVSDTGVILSFRYYHHSELSG